MSDKPENPPAFSCNPIYDNNGYLVTPGNFGMGLRDYFAGQALAGLAMNMSHDRQERINNKDTRAEWESSLAYILADAMLSERVRQGKQNDE